jgi:hypothetical protein
MSAPWRSIEPGTTLPKTSELPVGCSASSSDGERASVEALNDV